MIVPLFFYSHSVSIGRMFLGSLSHTSASPTVATHTFLYTYVVAMNAISFEKTFPYQLLSPYVLPDFYVVKFCVEIFLLDIDPTKIFQHENFSNKNFI